jgi:hypothetical protein
VRNSGAEHAADVRALFMAILQERVDLLDANARELLGSPDAWQALSDRSATEFGGMSARLGSSLADDGSPVATSAVTIWCPHRRRP